MIQLINLFVMSKFYSNGGGYGWNIIPGYYTFTELQRPFKVLNIELGFIGPPHMAYDEVIEDLKERVELLRNVVIYGARGKDTPITVSEGIHRILDRYLLEIDTDLPAKHQLQREVTDPLQEFIYDVVDADSLYQVRYSDKTLPAEPKALKKLNKFIVYNLWDGPEHPNTRRDDGQSRGFFNTDLMQSLASEDYAEVVETLTTNPEVNINLLDLEGKNVLLLAIKMARKDVVDTILERYPTVDLNTKDNNGMTALHYAYLYGDKELAETLTERGAAYMRNNDGSLPADLLSREFEEDLPETLWSVGIDPERDRNAVWNTIKASAGSSVDESGYGATATLLNAKRALEEFMREEDKTVHAKAIIKLQKTIKSFCGISYHESLYDAREENRDALMLLAKKHTTHHKGSLTPVYERSASAGKSSKDEMDAPSSGEKPSKPDDKP